MEVSRSAGYRRSSDISQQGHNIDANRSIFFLYSEIGELMSELQKRFQMDKMLERTVAACVNDFQVPQLLKLHSFPPDVILGLTFYHVNRRIGHNTNDDIIKVLIYFT